MVSNQKIRFFVQRVEQIQKKKIDEISGRYPEIKTEYVDLIASGKGIMKPEAEIRRIIGNTYRRSCPPVVEILDLFEFNGERQAAKEADAARIEKMDSEKAAIKTKVKAAMDLVYFGTDEQLKQVLGELEAL